MASALLVDSQSLFPPGHVAVQLLRVDCSRFDQRPQDVSLSPSSLRVEPPRDHSPCLEPVVVLRRLHQVQGFALAELSQHRAQLSAHALGVLAVVEQPLDLVPIGFHQCLLLVLAVLHRLLDAGRHSLQEVAQLETPC
eukprot:5989236-Pyramimonas_sp.AAC.1